MRTLNSCAALILFFVASWAVLASAAVADLEPQANQPERAALGVLMGSAQDGVRIVGIVGSSPAEQAGLHVGDVVRTVQGRAVRTPQQLADAVHQLAPGTTVDVAIRRGDRLHRIGATLASERETFALRHEVRRVTIADQAPAAPRESRNAAAGDRSSQRAFSVQLPDDDRPWDLHKAGHDPSILQ